MSNEEENAVLAQFGQQIIQQVIDSDSLSQKQKKQIADYFRQQREEEEEYESESESDEEEGESSESDSDSDSDSDDEEEESEYEKTGKGEIKCECGSVIKKKGLTKHRRTIKHKDYMKKK